MSETPFMPLWNGDFLADTLELDATEIGAYVLLIMAQWQRKGQSIPEKKLHRVARCGRSWPKVWASIERFFLIDDDGAYNPKCRELSQKRAAQTIVNSQNGARGGTAKALNTKKAAIAKATVSPQRKPTIPEPYIREEEREAKASPKKSGKPDLMDAIRLKAGVREDQRAWFGQAAAESVTIWMALGLTVAEIIETVGAWDRAGPPETPGALDGMMGARASEKRKPKPVVATKATSLTPEWFLPRKWGQWAFSEGMPIDEVRRQADIFRDYWLGIGTTAKGRKSDWEATWRNWIRKRLSEMPRGERNVTRSGEGQHLSQSAKRADPAAEQIARLARLGQTSGNGGGGDGGSGPEDGSIWLGEGPRHPG